MTKFTYKNNRGKQLDGFPFVVEADDILIADKELKEKTGFDPVKCAWIGCSIEFDLTS